MSTPIVPPRPTRANGTSAATTDGGTIPQVPPRPLRKTDPSPSRDFRSPLNELPNPMASLPKSTSRTNLTTADVPPRPPSVSSFPSIGQEGLEYASISPVPPVVALPTDTGSLGAADPEQTRNVAADMPLHAPKASVPQSTAKRSIETVTRTDSTQAAAAGIGKSKPDDDVHNTPADSTTSLHEPKGEDLRQVVSSEPALLRQKPSFSRPTSGTPQNGSRPVSVYDNEHEHGIPEIGRQIPLFPNAGDVQAPSPGLTQSQHTPGVGFFNDGSSRAHQRRRSGRHDFAPPGSYGLHSHNVEPADQFERDWYAKHPDRAALEGFNAYGRSRPETALSSEELNRIVTQNDDVGMGTNPGVVGTPGEDIGFSASDAYASRISPKPSPAPLRERSKRSSSGQQTVVESPLRRTSYPWNNIDQAVSNDDEGVVHIDPPKYRVSKITGGGPADDAVDLGPDAGNTEDEGGWFVERGTGTPILASDEVLKRQESSYMQPAVNPEYRYDEYEDAYDASRRSSLRVPSRPSSRPGSMQWDYQGGNLHRFMSHEEPHHGSGIHSPLEEIEEYEPLIPEGEEYDAPKPRSKETPKRPGLEHHHFPSQDIWEDTPSSLQFHTTVSTPDVVEERAVASTGATAAFETPEEEQKRKDQNPDDMTSDEKTLFKPHYASRVAGERPGVHRFLSRDVWEDTPDSLRYYTTVSGPQMDESMSPPDDRPTTTAIPGSQDDSAARATTTGMGQPVRPTIPARPKHKSKLGEEVKPRDIPDEQEEEGSREINQEKPPSPEKTKAPPIPDRPKPTVPARPARSSRTEQDEASGASLSKSISAEGQSPTDATAAPPLPTKAKPVVPARPGGEKLAALKSGFMNDLNNRLKIGPKAVPTQSREIEAEPAEETEKAPLADARKGRAKGPPRRKPASSPSTLSEAKPASFSMSSPLTIWSIDADGALQVPTADTTLVPTKSAPAEIPTPTLERALTENTIANTEEPVLSEPLPGDKAISSPTPTMEPLEKTNSPEERKAVRKKLEAELADVGAGPAPVPSPGAEDGEAAETAKGEMPSETVKDESETTTADQAVEEQAALEGGDEVKVAE